MLQVLLRPIVGNHLAILLRVQLVLGERGQDLLLSLHLLVWVTIMARNNLALTSPMLASALDIVTMAVRAAREGCVIGWSMRTV